MLKIPVLYSGSNELPHYASGQAAGLDLRANISEAVELAPMERRIISSGLAIALPSGYEAQVRPRSGLAAKFGITVLNSPGTIDADYRGDIGVILINLAKEKFTIQPGDRIAQLVVAQFTQIEWEAVTELDNTDRGAKGFGSTGKS